MNARGFKIDRHLKCGLVFFEPIATLYLLGSALIYFRLFYLAVSTIHVQNPPCPHGRCGLGKGLKTVTCTCTLAHP